MRSKSLVRAATVGAVLLSPAFVVLGQRETHPVLVELFTSEGCSSCPPADALLRQIDAKRTDSGQLVVGISEHVTYWNRLGWADPFSAETYTSRQEMYRSRFGLESAYTPQMVVNGSREVLGSDRGAVLRAVRDTDRSGSGGAASFRLHIDSVKLSGGNASVAYSTSGDAAGKGVEILAVIAEDAVRSEVPRGENAGRTLAHVSVARSLTLVGTAHGATARTVNFPLGTFPRGAGKRHLILFAQTEGLGPVVSVDVAPL